jgi:MSHA biogenesis protein MshO
MSGARAAAGFTLIELVLVIVITGIIAGLVALNITEPIRSFTDTARRAALVDVGDTALNRLAREARLALPNSMRVSGTEALEFLRTRVGGRYRAVPDPDAPSDELDFNAQADSFDVIGQLSEFDHICTAAAGNCGGSSPTGSADCMSGTHVDCLVIYNTGQPTDCASMAGGRTNAYCGDNVAGVEAVDLAGGSVAFSHDLVDGFPYPSPVQRFYVVDTPVSYICDPVARTLTRYDGYAIGALQPTLASPPAVVGRVLADKVVGCRFEYQPGVATRAALLTVELTLADPEASEERVELFQQIHVRNAP